MYEYTPRSRRKKEFWIVAILTLAATFLFCCSTLPNCPYPSLWQLTCVVLLVAVIMLVSKCLLRSFIYRVELREGASVDEAAYDLIVLECYGKRRTVVCRVALSDIENVRCVTQENRKELFKQLRGKQVYRYFSELTPTNSYLLTLSNADMEGYLWIVADERLLLMLQKP